MEEQVKQAFAREGLVVIRDSKKLLEFLHSENGEKKNLLLMNLGNFYGVDDIELAGDLL